MSDTINRQDAIDCVTYDEEYTIECLKTLSSAESEAYKQGWADGQEALRKEIWEDGRGRLN